MGAEFVEVGFADLQVCVNLPQRLVAVARRPTHDRGHEGRLVLHLALHVDALEVGPQAIGIEHAVVEGQYHAADRTEATIFLKKTLRQETTPSPKKTHPPMKILQ